MTKKIIIACTEHLPASVIIGLWFSYVTAKSEHLLVAVTFGWLVDADHFLDYFYFSAKKKNKWSLKQFLSGVYFKESGKIFLVMHSFELCFVLGLLAIFYTGPLADLFFTACVALTVHLIHDQITNRPHILGYFFCARLYSKFEANWFCRIKKYH
jgi:hypothetical protein